MGKKITIGDVAEALGVSKTTVSRSISGKGRIGKDTRDKVLAYIDEHDYKPNVIAKGLAQSKTYNICVAMPSNYELAELPFFQEALLGIMEVAGDYGYDVLLGSAGGNDVTSMGRIIANKKVDGVILLRTYTKDKLIAHLRDEHVTFVTIGSSDYEDVYQVDHDHKEACRILTEMIASKGVSKIALLGGRESIVVNSNRYRGFEEGIKSIDTSKQKAIIYKNLENDKLIEKALEDAIKNGVECVICMDDGICMYVNKYIYRKRPELIGQIHVASFYITPILKTLFPEVTGIDFHAKLLGEKACENLVSLLDGENVERRTLLEYDFQ